MILKESLVLEHIIGEFLATARDEYKFYLIPMLAFVIEKTLEQMSSVDMSADFDRVSAII